MSGLVKQLDGVAPRFEVDAGDVEVLRGPAEFYEALKVSLWIELCASKMWRELHDCCGC